ncbi:aminotransferase class I/II-fold pyridoxal phosphate-dependent enzyme [Rhodococcus erythropolis]|uniref:aminotransferase class I/II-fold pyridoxal phosphate-dependent enzyme n=1 Tax=Rhodococcus erythropolis TaxID=1833 RepID=UPI003013D99C
MSTFVPSQRVAGMHESPSMAAAQHVRELRASGRQILDLTAGEPDFDTPANVAAAAINAINAGATRYTPVNGTPELRAAIAKRANLRTGLSYDDAHITVGSGAKQVIFNALMATVDAGDEVIVPAPYWVSYPTMIQIHGGTPVVVECTESDGFVLTAERLTAAITASTKWVIINSPSNPTGAVYSEEQLASLAAVFEQHPHINILWDEIYDEITFNGPAPNIAAVAPQLRDRILVVNGVSKTYAMTGWRLGYGLGNPELIRAINAIQSQSTSCASSISQAAAVEALNGEQKFVAAALNRYRDRKDTAYRMISDIEGLMPIKPAGAFYLFINCGAILGSRTPSGRTLSTDVDVTDYILEKYSVATIPGSAFGASPYFRITCATSDETLETAILAIREAVTNLEPPAASRVAEQNDFIQTS